MRVWLASSLLFFIQTGWAAGAMCTLTELGDPCPQGGVATLGAATPAPNGGVGNPVDRRSGNKYQRDTDLPDLKRAPGLELVRHYNAMDPRQSALGRGWSWSYDTRVYDMGGQVQVLQADGSHLRFECDRAGRCVSAQVQRGVIRRHRLGWDWLWPTGKCLRFDAPGRLTGWSYVAQAFSLKPAPAPAQCAKQPAVRIVRHQAPSRWHGEIDQVIHLPTQERLKFFYERTPSPGAQTRESSPKPLQASGTLVAVQTPKGLFRYVHQAGFLSGVIRPDAMQRRYHQEPFLQQGRSEALTGISLAGANAAHVLRTHTWQYDSAGRAQKFVPGSPEALVVGLPTTVSDAALGLVIDYDARRAIQRLSFNARGWPGLALRFDDKGRLAQWHSRGVTPERLAYRALPTQPAGETMFTDQTLPLPLISRHFSEQEVWRWRFDSFGRVRVLQARSQFAKPVDVRVAWRGARPQVVAHPEETQIWRTNPSGQLREREVIRRATRADWLSVLWPEWRYREQFTYDTLGRRVTHTLPEGGQLRYHWTATQLQAIQWIRANGAKQWVFQAGALGLTHGNGLLTLRQLGTAQTETQRALGLEQLVVYQPSTRQALYRQRLSLNLEGVLSHEYLWLNGQEQSTRYDYDPERRLSRYRTHTTGRDATGQAYSWLRSGAARPALARDATGLPTRVGSFVLQYNAQRRLSRVVDVQDATRAVTYGHNAFSERIWRQEGQTRTQYLFDQQQLVAQAREVRGRIQVTRRFIYAQQVPVAVIEYGEQATSAELYFFHTDAVGLPQFLTDAKQAIRWRASYSPFGQLLEQTHDLGEQFVQPLRLPGQVVDPLTGWHDNYQRTYDPGVGHYLEPDPLGPVPGNSQYGYAQQQPRKYADPLGLLLFAFDGTANHAASQTNVWLFAQQYRGGPVKYIEGPAGDLGLDATQKATDAAIAWSGKQRVDRQWERWLNAVALQREGAQALALDVVGFSRGAALARHFGNRVVSHLRDGRFWLQHPTLGTLSSCVDLRFMGLFDTVAQFNVLGAGNAAFDLTIAPAWKWVSHAVALHEHRWLFPLTAARGTQRSSNVIERAFVGAHADIGGGYLTRQTSLGSTPGDLSHVALAWMHWQAQAAGVPLGPGPDKASVKRPIVHDERAVFHRSMQRTDRRVNQPDGTKWVDYQEYAPGLGAELRRQAESLLEHRSPLLPQASDSVGWVNMERYTKWLRDTAGWHWD